MYNFPGQQQQQQQQQQFENTRSNSAANLNLNEFPILGAPGGSGSLAGGQGAGQNAPIGSNSMHPSLSGPSSSTFMQHFDSNSMASILSSKHQQQQKQQYDPSSFNHQQQEFQPLQKEDFPALGARSNLLDDHLLQQQQQQQHRPNLRNPNSWPQQQYQTDNSAFNQQQQQRMPRQNAAPVNNSAGPSGATPNSAPATPDKFGLLGLLGVIRMTDQDLNTLALGCDLTTLGLNLNSSDELYSSFLSPWPDNPMDISKYTLPSCYNVPQTPNPRVKIASFSDETLFYIFYCMPRDELQDVAAEELYRRNWRYHKDLKLWLTKEPNVPEMVYAQTAQYEKGVYIFWDVQHWCRVSKEFVVYYEMLETREQQTKPATQSLSSSSGSISQQQGFNTGGSLQLNAGGNDPVMLPSR